MIRKCFLLKPMAKRVRRLLGPWGNIFSCLQPTVDCQRLRCSEEAQEKIMFWAVLLVQSQS